MSDDEDDWEDTLGKLAIISGAAILGGLLLKALFDHNTNIHRCPRCNLVIGKWQNRCPRCGQPINWGGIY